MIAGGNGMPVCSVSPAISRIVVRLRSPVTFNFDDRIRDSTGGSVIYLTFWLWKERPEKTYIFIIVNLSTIPGPFPPADPGPVENIVSMILFVI